MTTTTARPRPAPHLDNLTLARKEGWRDFVQAPPRTRPESLSKRQIRGLGEGGEQEYNRRRADWHNNLGPFKTPMLTSVHEALWDILDCNEQDGQRAKGAVAIDGYPGLGKSCAIEEFAKKYHQREIARYGDFTRAGDERWPVCRVGLRGNTSMKDFNTAICDFYAHPGRRRVTTTQLGKWALDCVLSCETRLLIVDDVHFLHWQQHGGIEISNHFKYIANDFPVTLLLIGVGLGERGILMDGPVYEDAVLAQTLRRTTTLEMRPYAVNSERARRQWRTLLSTVEERLVLAHKRPGMLTDGEMLDYLFIRSTGHIGSLMELIRRGCARAVRTGAEALTHTVLDAIRIDSAAERARAELEVAFRTRRLSAHTKTTRATVS
ncbi:AAA family ATPase [Mycolicibacter kumamotonensis]|uniref:AAA family ATPase n=2 Tax=Mycobacteriaceae TaxID=1762 RepID=A0A1X1WJI4_MYCIR|nr:MULTISPECIES: ATP-binding protein [Mycobacteriaceae]ORA76755.1 AAA family ATPase [Mycolicibacter kumamotonensis]ORV86761.1 AAA family ATPase [Mycolicibacterium iranicum]